MRAKLGLFRCQNEGYALPLERLQRVVDSGLAQAIPSSPATMAGILVLGNEIVPLVDTGWLPGCLPGQGLETSFRVLVETEYGPVALPATQTVGVVSEAQCQQQETALPESFVTREIIYHHFHYLVLDLDALIFCLIHPLNRVNPTGAGGIKC